MLDPHVQAVGIDPGSLCCEIDPLTFFIDNFFFILSPSFHLSVACNNATLSVCLFPRFFFFSLTPFSPPFWTEAVLTLLVSAGHMHGSQCVTLMTSCRRMRHFIHLMSLPHLTLSVFHQHWHRCDLTTVILKHRDRFIPVYATRKNVNLKHKNIFCSCFFVCFFFPSFFCGRMSPQRLLCGPSGHFWIFSLIIILYLELNRPLSTDFLFCVWIAINTSCLSWFSAWLPDSLARYCLLI